MKKLLLLLIVLPGCCVYKMPTDKHIATSPNINNPTVTREKPTSFMPGMK